MSLLDIQNLEVAYGGIRAIKGISLTIKKGELVCLIGANGAGKTTTLKTITGLLAPRAGSILLNQINLANIPTHQRLQKGLALVPEGRGIFPKLTVLENLQMGAYIREDQQEVALDLATNFERFPRLKERAKQLAGTLSGGEQQLLAMARALMGRPQLLLLDEPSMGLAPLMVEKIFETIKEISQSGVTILLVEQNARLALQVSQRGYVLDGGLITLQDNAQALLHNPQVQHAYLGET